MDLMKTLHAKAGAPDSSWVDLVVQAIQANVSGIRQPEFKQAVIAATVTLATHKEDIAHLGVYGLTTFLQKLAVGDQEGAYVLFIETQATFQDLIDGQEADAAAVIAAKQKRDEMLAKAISIAFELAVDGARILLPFLLALL